MHGVNLWILLSSIGLVGFIFTRSPDFFKSIFNELTIPLLLLITVVMFFTGTLVDENYDVNSGSSVFWGGMHAVLTVFVFGLLVVKIIIFSTSFFQP